MNTDKSVDYSANNAGFSPLHHYYYYDAQSVVDAATRYLENHKYVDELDDVLYDDEL